MKLLRKSLDSNKVIILFVALKSSDTNCHKIAQQSTVSNCELINQVQCYHQDRVSYVYYIFLLTPAQKISTLC